MNMEPEQRRCKNKKCQSILSVGHQGKYCGECQAARAERRRAAGEKFVNLLCAPGIVAMSLATRNNRHYNEKK